VSDSSHAAVEEAVRTLLASLGLDAAQDPELAGTPARVASLLKERFAPQEERPRLSPLAATSHGIVVVRQVPFHSLCVHHMVPFFGTIDLAYAPDASIAGFGAFERLVAWAASGPQLQERLTEAVADAVAQDLEPVGLVVRSRARQMCMELTGAGHPSDTTVVVASGSWAADPTAAALRCFA
jgi:GTP cyclohydrolase I